MEKPAPVQHPIHELLQRRWSPHAFASRPVEPQKLQSLFEAARWAASSFNEQPWSFLIAIKDQPAEFSKMLDCLVEGNRLWAQAAPVLIITVAKLAFDKSGKPNRHALHDVGQATANLSMQATAEVLFLHQMAGFDPAKAREAYAIPPTHEPVAVIALGYPGDVTTLPEALRQRTLAERSRKPIDQFVFSGKWGQTASSLK
jgi:nitroreductase